MIYSLYSIILRNSNALRDLRWYYPGEEFILYNIRIIDNTFVLSWRWRIIHHFLLLYSWEGKLPQLRSWSRAIGNLIRRLRCTARTVKSDGLHHSRCDAFAIRVSRMRIDRRDIARGWPMGSAVLFYSRARRIASINFRPIVECRLSVSKFLSKLHTKFHTCRIALFDDCINIVNSRAWIKHASVYASICII